jgi:hypothetical protein
LLDLPFEYAVVEELETPAEFMVPKVDDVNIYVREDVPPLLRDIIAIHEKLESQRY